MLITSKTSIKISKIKIILLFVYVPANKTVVSGYASAIARPSTIVLDVVAAFVGSFLVEL